MEYKVIGEIMNKIPVIGDSVDKVGSDFVRYKSKRVINKINPPYNLKNGDLVTELYYWIDPDGILSVNLHHDSGVNLRLSDLIIKYKKIKWKIRLQNLPSIFFV